MMIISEIALFQCLVARIIVTDNPTINENLKTLHAGINITGKPHNRFLCLVSRGIASMFWHFVLSNYAASAEARIRSEMIAYEKTLLSTHTSLYAYHDQNLLFVARARLCGSGIAASTVYELGYYATVVWAAVFAFAAG